MKAGRCQPGERYAEGRGTVADEGRNEGRALSARRGGGLGTNGSVGAIRRNEGRALSARRGRSRSRVLPALCHAAMKAGRYQPGEVPELNEILDKAVSPQ